MVVRIVQTKFAVINGDSVHGAVNSNIRFRAFQGFVGSQAKVSHLRGVPSTSGKPHPATLKKYFLPLRL